MFCRIPLGRNAAVTGQARRSITTSPPLTIHKIGNKTFVQPRGGMLINLDHVTHINQYRAQLIFHSELEHNRDWTYHFDRPGEATHAYQTLTGTLKTQS